MQSNKNESGADDASLLPVKSERRGSDREQALDARRTEIHAYPIGSNKFYVLLPRLGRPFSDFADDMGRTAQKALGNKLADTSENKKEQNGNTPADPSNPNECFLCRRNGVVGMIVQEKGVARQHSGLVFTAMTSDQAITELERWIQTGVEKTLFGQKIFAPSSMTRVTSVTLMASSQFHQYLPKVERIFDFAIPYGFTQQKHRPPKASKQTDKKTDAQPAMTEETFVAGTGKTKLTGIIRRMEPGFNKYTQKNGETVHYYCNRKLEHHLSVDQAREVIRKLFAEFTFADDQSRIHAIARLLTPYCQGLMGWRKRSPLWIFTADKPRAGKDYLAMLTPLVHSHWAVQDPPLETDDEVKRRITAALASGRRFMHFANCRKDLDHPSLEAAITSEFWSDRIIRSSSEVTVPNEIIFSLSYNESLPISPDLVARSRQIRLLGKDGDANAYQYKNSDLHDVVTRFDSADEVESVSPDAKPQPEAERLLEAKTKLCRRNILAALEALIRNWAENNCPHGPTFTSFPEWSRVVGGIMIAAKLGNPCEKDETLVATTLGSWKDDFTTLAEAVCVEHEKKFFTVGSFYDSFIKQNPDKYPVFQAYIEEYNPKTFAAQFGKQLKHLLAVKLQGDGASYVLVQGEIKSPAKYCFVAKAKNPVPPKESGGKSPAPANENLDQYTLPEEMEQKAKNDFSI